MYKPGKTVIVTQDDVNRVGVVLDEYKVNKQTVYDVLLELLLSNYVMRIIPLT